MTLKFVFELSNKKLGAHSSEPPVFAVSKYDGVVLASEYFDKRIASSSLDGYKLVNSDDWVYSTIHIDEGSISRNHFPYAGVVSPMYTTMRWIGRDDLASYFELLLTSDLAIRAYRDNAQGTVNRRRSLSWGTFSTLEFVVPSFQVQQRIVDLVSSVDSYIAALQQHADLTRSARSAMLSELLSAGGDDWTETTLGDVADVKMGQSPPGDTYNADGIGIPFMQGSAEFGEHYPEPVKFCSAPAKIAEIGDLLLSVRAPVGDSNFANQRIAIGRGLAAVCAKRGADTYFLRLVIQLNTAGLLAASGTGMFSSITGKNLREFAVNLPPIAEQTRIVAVISSMDEVIQSADEAVTDAKNLRSGLLSDLLSGDHEIPGSYDRLLGAV